jgi:hypothetical protein
MFFSQQGLKGIVALTTAVSNADKNTGLVWECERARDLKGGKGTRPHHESRALLLTSLVWRGS